MVKTEMRIFGAIIAVALICTAIVAVREDTRYTAPETVPLCEIVPDPDAININTAGIDELCMLDGNRGDNHKFPHRHAQIRGYSRHNAGSQGRRKDLRAH